MICSDLISLTIRVLAQFLWYASVMIGGWEFFENLISFRFWPLKSLFDLKVFFDLELNPKI